MQLLIATDHRFFRTTDGIFDNYCFDRDFFTEYSNTFDTVTVAARVRDEAPPAGSRRSDGGNVRFVCLADRQGAIWGLLPSRLALRGLRHAVETSDAVCVRIPSRTGISAAAWAFALGKPVMFELIGDPSAALDRRQHGVLRWLYGRMQARAVRTICQHATVGSYVSRRHLQALYPPGQSTAHDSISSLRLDEGQISSSRRWHASQAAFRVVTVASLVPVKQHITLVRAIALLRSSNVNVAWDVIGDGPLRDDIANHARALNIQDAVEFHGHVSDRTRLVTLLDQADLFVLTSASEGMPRAMIEAMSRGLPAVGTRVGGIAELLDPPDLVEVGDYRALAKRIAELTSDRSTLESLSAKSVAIARTFSSNILASRRRLLLSQLLCAARGAR